MSLPEFIKLFWKTPQRLLPAALLLVYGPATISTNRTWKLKNLYLRLAVLYCSLDDQCRLFRQLFIRNTRRFRQLLDECVLLRFGCRAMALRFGCLLSLGKG